MSGRVWKSFRAAGSRYARRQVVRHSRHFHQPCGGNLAVVSRPHASGTSGSSCRKIHQRRPFDALQQRRAIRPLDYCQQLAQHAFRIDRAIQPAANARLARIVRHREAWAANDANGAEIMFDQQIALVRLRAARCVIENGGLGARCRPR